MLLRSSSTPTSPLTVVGVVILSLMVLVVLLPKSAVLVGATSLVLDVAPYDEECFMLRFGPAAKPPTGNSKIKVILEGSYEQIDDHLSSDPLVVRIFQEISGTPKGPDDVSTEQDNKELFKSRNKKRSNFRIPLADVGGKYWMCVQNHKMEKEGKKKRRDGDDDAYVDDDHVDFQDRVVGFSYNVLYENEAGTDPYFDGGEKKEQLGPIKVEEYSSQWFTKAESLRRSMKNLVQHHDYMRVRESKHRELTEKTFSDVLRWTLIEAATVFSVVGDICGLFAVAWKSTLVTWMLLIF